MPRSPLQELDRRQLIAQISDREGLDAHLESKMRTLYCGFDPTADSLHIGNLVPLLTLRRFQRAGHRPIALVGGATGLIGDPSGKLNERLLNEKALVDEWVARIKLQVSKFLDFDQGACAAEVADNLDWTRDLDVIGFLRDIGKHFSVNAMIQKESVRSRLQTEGEGLSFTEFSYMVLQSMDYMELAKRYDCTLQIGGSDQWGNITSGMDLVRRTLGREAYAMTVPLVTKADGTKFGKTEAGTIWLDPARTSPYAFYQFWLNTSDADVVNFLQIFTFKSIQDISQLADAVVHRPEAREAQQRLADDVTALVHGEEGVASARRITDALFRGKMADLTQADFEQLGQDGLESARIKGDAIGILELLVASGLAQSKAAAKRLVESKGIRVDGRQVTDIETKISAKDGFYQRYHLIRRGKKHWRLALHEST